jgi:hypothetical protein
MSTLTIPNAFSPNSTIQSALVNADFNAIASWANGNIDNTNVGAAGIYASQIIPTNGAQATFGSTQSYTFSNGATLSTLADVSVPFAVFGHSVTQSGDLFDAFNFNGGGNTKVFSVGPTGNLAVTGNLQASSNASTKSYVPPAYTNTGAAVAATWHTVSGTGTVLNGQTQLTITLTAAAQFASSSYQVLLTMATAGAGQVVFNSNKATGSFVINLSAAAGIGGVPVDWMAIGA